MARASLAWKLSFHAVLLWVPGVAEYFAYGYSVLGASLVAQLAKNPRAMQEIPGREDPLEKGKTAHSSILAWRIPRTEEPGGLQSTGSQSQTRLSA